MPEGKPGEYFQHDIETKCVQCLYGNFPTAFASGPWAKTCEYHEDLNRTVMANIYKLVDPDDLWNMKKGAMEELIKEVEKRHPERKVPNA